jgi:hypothetical protein
MVHLHHQLSEFLTLARHLQQRARLSEDLRQLDADLFIIRKEGELVMTFPRGELPMDYAGGCKFVIPDRSAWPLPTV